MDDVKYKVVWVYKGQRKSLLMQPEFNGSLCRVYTPGKWTTTTAKALRYGFGLTYFTDYETALYWCKNLPSENEIWEIETRGEMPLPWARLDLDYAHTKRMNPTGHIEYEWTWLGWPKNTGMAKRIKLTRRLTLLAWWAY